MESSKQQRIRCHESIFYRVPAGYVYLHYHMVVIFVVSDVDRTSHMSTTLRRNKPFPLARLLF